MAKTFWLGAGAGILVSMAGAALDGRFGRGEPRSSRSEPGSDGGASIQELREQLASAERELAKVKAEAKERMDSRSPAASTPFRTDAVAQPTASAIDDPRQREAGARGKVPGLSQSLDESDLEAAASALSAAFEQGAITKVDLMQLAVEYPGLIVEGVNDYSFPDAFRSVLLDSLSSLADPLATIGELDLDQEPNQRFSSKIADLIADSVDVNARPDPRIVSTIEELLSGNSMLGEKVNLYPVLAQLGAMGDQQAMAMLQGSNVGPFSAGLVTLLNPPSRDERGNLLTGAIIYSVQYNKGQWENRPRQFQSGDVVVSIGADRVTSASDFFNLVKKHHDTGRYDFVEAGVFRPIPQYAGQFEHKVLQLDPGDLQLLYGVYSVKR